MSKKQSNDNLEDELDNTRIKLNELTKDMTSQESAEYINRRAREITTEQALQEYHTTLIEVVKRLKNKIVNYSYYLTDFGRKKDGTTPHVFSGSPKFLYNAMQDDVPLADWISQAISNKNPNDVGSRFVI